MDRRSWLWRRKSSEKSPSGDTESSGTLSSHSERYSDDQSLVANQNMQSPEVTSKTVPGDEDRNDSLKTLSEKLSEAILDVRTKEDLVKQHAKVAEEAVTGWEKAENEVSILKKQAEALTQKNSILEERVGHLDGALKECLRELRQAREDQEQKIYDIIANRTREWDSTKSELENQLADMFSKLETAEKENSILKLKLVSKTEELERRTCERDLSTHAAESASKQHLECIKKIANLEAECRRLKAVICKATPGNDHGSGVEEKLVIENCSCERSGLESIGGEPCRLESWSSASVTEEGQFKNERSFERSLMIPSAEIDLMDDFLEMEKIVALPVIQGGNNSNTIINSREDHLKDDLEAMINRTAELEENLEKIEMEKMNLEVTLNDCRIQLKTSEDQLKQTEVKFLNLIAELAVADKEKRASQKEIEFMKEKHEHLTNLELEIETMHSTISSLKTEVGKERNFSKELETELSRMKFDYKSQRSAMVEEFRIIQDKELAAAKNKYAECQKTLASLDGQLKILATLDDFSTDSEEPVQIP